MKRIYTILSCLLLVGMLCIGLYALLALSLNVILGQAGIFHMGHAAFFAVGRLFNHQHAGAGICSSNRGCGAGKAVTGDDNVVFGVPLNALQIAA